MGEIRTPFRGRRTRQVSRSFPQGASKSVFNSMSFSSYYTKEYTSLLVVDNAGSPQTAPASTPPVMAPHRYWRIFITKNNGDASNTAITELEMFTSRGGANVIGGGTAFGSNFLAGMPYSEAFDGLYNDVSGTAGSTWAATGGGTQINWLGYDFGAGNEKGIIGLKMAVRVTPFMTQAPVDFIIQWSDDGVNYTNAWEVIGSTGYTSLERRDFYHPLF